MEIMQYNYRLHDEERGRPDIYSALAVDDLDALAQIGKNYGLHLGACDPANATHCMTKQLWAAGAAGRGLNPALSDVDENRIWLRRRTGHGPGVRLRKGGN
jgi:hypothetical protein